MGSRPPFQVNKPPTHPPTYLLYLLVVKKKEENPPIYFTYLS